MALVRRIAAETEAPTGTPEAAAEAAARWIEARKAAVDQARAMLEEIETRGDGWSFAKLSLAHAALREAAA